LKHRSDRWPGTGRRHFRVFATISTFVAPQPHFGAKEKLMAKSQKHGNKEAKKPKQIKTPLPAVTEGLLAKAGGGPGASKKRG
jgi:hypothetical protein